MREYQFMEAFTARVLINYTRRKTKVDNSQLSFPRINCATFDLKAAIKCRPLKNFTISTRTLLMNGSVDGFYKYRVFFEGKTVQFVA